MANGMCFHHCYPHGSSLICMLHSPPIKPAILAWPASLHPHSEAAILYPLVSVKLLCEVVAWCCFVVFLDWWSPRCPLPYKTLLYLLLRPPRLHTFVSGSCYDRLVVLIGHPVTPPISLPGPPFGNPLPLSYKNFVFFTSNAAVSKPMYTNFKTYYIVNCLL